MMRSGALLLVGLLLLVSAWSRSAPACDDTSVRASCPAPTPEPAEPLKGPSSPPLTTQPAQVDLIRAITVNGHPAEGPSIKVPPEQTEVVIQFTVPMSQGSVEYHLRDLPAGTSFSLYLSGALAADGQSVDNGKRALYVSRIRPTRFRLYDPAALLAGGPALVESSLHVPEGAAFELSRDRLFALVFSGDPFVPPSAPFLVNLRTGERTELTAGSADPLYCWAGWGAKGGPLFLDVDTLWHVADGSLFPISRQPKRGCRLAERSPDGRYLASWAPLRLIDLQTGSIVTVADRFEPIAQDGGVRPYWSPEGDQVAMGNAAQSGIWSGPIETVIVALDGSIVRRIPDWWPVAWLPDGDLAVFRPLAMEKVERTRLTREGHPSPRPVPPDGDFSPDGRWVIPYAPGTRQLIELATGRQVALPDVTYTRWLPDSTLLLVER